MCKKFTMASKVTGCHKYVDINAISDTIRMTVVMREGDDETSSLSPHL